MNKDKYDIHRKYRKYKNKLKLIGGIPWSDSIPEGTIIIGPERLVYYKNVSGRNIVLFGEDHRANVQKKQINENDVYFHNYLIKLLKTAQRNGKCLDFYIEKGYKLKRDPKEINNSTEKSFEYTDYQNKAYMRYLRNLCSQYLEKQSNIRIHNLDIRIIYETSIANVINEPMPIILDSYPEKNTNDYLLLSLILDNRISENVNYNQVNLQLDNINSLLKKLDDFRKEIKPKKNNSSLYPKIRSVNKQLNKVRTQIDETLDIASFYFYIIYLNNSKFRDNLDLVRIELQRLLTRAPVFSNNNKNLTKQYLSGWFDFFMSKTNNPTYPQIIITIRKIFTLISDEFDNLSVDESVNYIAITDSVHSHYNFYFYIKRILDKQFSKTTVKDKYEIIRTAFIDEFLEWSTDVLYSIEKGTDIIGTPLENNTYLQLYILSGFTLHLYTDLFTFFRMFSDWSSKDSQRERIKGCTGDEYQQKNIIVYSGSRHTKFLSKMIDACFETSPEKDIKYIHDNSHIIIDEKLNLF